MHESIRKARENSESGSDKNILYILYISTLVNIHDIVYTFIFTIMYVTAVL